MKILQTLWNEIAGYKTYIVSVAAIVYGIYVGNSDLVVLGLGLAGVRNGISHEVAKIVTSTNPKETIKEEAPVLATTAVEAAVEAAGEATAVTPVQQ